MQSSSEIITTNKPTSIFYRPDALPVAQPTMSKHWRENITFQGLAHHPKLTWGLPTLSLTTNSSWLPWGRVVMPLISSLMPVLLMLCNAIFVRRTECFYFTFTSWLSLKGRDLATVIAWRLIGTVLMALQNELRYVHTYHQIVFVERRLMGEGGS